MDIKPIETYYNGYRFRSRLEARWAVFFDAAGIKYEYELEGFELKSGRRYLPDFWLPEFGIYVEIKPQLDRYDPQRHEEYDNQETLCADFRDEVGKAILLYRGNPWDDCWGILFAFDKNDSGGGAAEYDARFVDVSTIPSERIESVLMVGETRYNRYICVDGYLQNQNRKVVNAQMMFIYYPTYSAHAVLREMTDSFNPNGNDMFNAAKLTAKQSRFEFGETPVIKGVR